ncbi:inorganic phosphate transporter [Candidatus Woesearchaeota archaeon]|nr:inorganic phosphate transporter [Candidatus Woesearchaeota archaeon]
MLDGGLILVIIIILVALIFDFGNGVNDAANAVSTVVATGVLSLRAAVLMSAFFNFAGAFVFGVAVAKTIGKGIIDSNLVTPYVVLASLCGAIFWVYLMTRKGFPISVSHSLIGGLVGVGLAKAGLKSIIYSGVTKVVIFIFVAPLLGLVGAMLFSAIVFHFSRNSDPRKVNKHFRWLQLISASVYSLGHGTNDAQKTMGIIAILLFSAGYLSGEFYVPFWIVLLSHGTIALGTLIGGRKVIHTMGHKITKLRPVNGFCAETAGASVIIGATQFGIPVSTTHVIAGSIMGVGAAKRVSAVRWGVANKILWSWILTIPVSAAVAALSYLVISLFI